jgi:bifunctional UDP-N-acetylglucosamine pyrophosphorylase/glucosamine-1-phosphate N-acetyltransferase
MRPLTDTQPKPVLPVAGEPLVTQTARTAVTAGASRFVVVVGYQASAVRKALGSHIEGVPVKYAEQSDQRGTADAVRVAAPELDDAPFAVLNGDTLFDEPSLDRLFGEGPAVGSYRVDDPTQYGVLETTADTEAADKMSTRVTGVIEKPANPPSNLVNTGAYVFPAEARNWLDVTESKRGEAELTDVLERTASNESVQAVSFNRWLDVGRPWELLEANEWILTQLNRQVAEGATVHETAELRGDVVVKPGAEIDAGVVIEGPALIDSDASVGPNAYVRGASYLAPDTKVGHSVEVKNSVLMQGATVGHLSYVGDSILGRNVNFGAGTTVANLRHDDNPVETTVKGTTVSTGRRKFGVVCGDQVKTGIQTSLNAGCVLETGETTIPGEQIL